MLPPDMMAAFGGAGADPSGAPVDAQAPSEAPSEGGGSTTEILERMIADAQAYIEVEQDAEDKLTMTKVLTTLQGYLAAEQKEQDDLLAGKASPKVLRKAATGGGE